MDIKRKCLRFSNSISVSVLKLFLLFTAGWHYVGMAHGEGVIIESIRAVDRNTFEINYQAPVA
jgi:hypothetical protein